jgi:SHS2 domain-containing protein
VSDEPGPPYELAGYFPHGADIGVVGRGATPEEALTNAAGAMFAISCQPDAVRPSVSFSVTFEEDDLEYALVTWLNLLLSEARIRGLALGRFALTRQGSRWAGEAWGEPWSPTIERGTEVKGATLTGLSVRPDDGGWEARCVVDV